MGKNLIQQRRGKGTTAFRVPSFRYEGKVKHISLGKDFEQGVTQGFIKDIIHCQGHSAPLVRVVFGKQETLMIAPEGVHVGYPVFAGRGAAPNTGNTLALSEIPDGTSIYNIENAPGDGGKLVRTSGSSAKILSKTKEGVLVMLPSKNKKLFNPACKACIGVIAGGGRNDKPMLKAGVSFYKNKARNKFYPKVSGLAMNAVAHPYGGSRSSKLGKVTIAPRFAPPGRKVGLIRPRRTGGKK
nr:large subunit ribosomal protein L2 [uncultured archaeon]